MHPHFYHWHSRAELKPDAAILEPRWEASKAFAAKASQSDVCSLLRLALFPGAPEDFAKRFSDELVKLEPTFPPQRNAELLRVMATAGLYSQMKGTSRRGDAVALGLIAAQFPEGRSEPICSEIMQRAAEYLATESEDIRPEIRFERLKSLKKELSADTESDDSEVTAIMGEALFELENAIRRLSEESQFLWWIIGRRSPLLDRRRDKLHQKQYSLAVAIEAAERVVLLPPAMSVESLIDEALAQCNGVDDSPKSLVNLIDGANHDTLPFDHSSFQFFELTPVTGILVIRRAGQKADAKTLASLFIPSRFKTHSSEIAHQYFRELMFLRALNQLML